MPSLRRALVAALLLAAGYLATLLWAQHQQPLKGPGLDVVGVAVVQAAGLSLLAFAIRFFRWRWLLQRTGHRFPCAAGFLAYLTGFALTATPGKLGELLRMRYFKRLGVPGWQVVSAFLFERSFDLLAVLLLAGLVIGQPAVFGAVLSFVLLSLLGLLILILRPRAISLLAFWLAQRRLHRMARLLWTFRRALKGCSQWFNVFDVFISSALGLLAWTLVAVAFVLVLHHLRVSIPRPDALGIYPMAMLAGAASMLPGGLGSTEAVIVMLLSRFDIASATAVLAAVSIRMATLWFSIACGLAATVALEWRGLVGHGKSDKSPLGTSRRDQTE